MCRSASLSWLYVVRVGLVPARLPAFRLCDSTLISQDNFKSAISERIGKCAPGCVVTAHSAKLAAVPLPQFPSPETKPPAAHYAVPVDPAGSRVTHLFAFSRSLSSNSISENPNRDRFLGKRGKREPRLFNHISEPYRELSTFLRNEGPQNQGGETF